MARRTRAEEAPKQEEIVSNETLVDFPDQEDVEQGVTESAEQESVEQGETEGVEQDGKKSFDELYPEITAAISEAIEKSDPDTGDVDEASLEAVRIEFRNLDDGKARRKAKQYVEELMFDAMPAQDIRTARACREIIKRGLRATRAASEKAPSEPRQPVNPTEAFVAQAAKLRVAMDLLVEAAPETLDENWKDLVAEQVSNLKVQNAEINQALAVEVPEGEEAPVVEIPPILKAARKLAEVKATRAPRAKGEAKPRGEYVGTRRSVADHIAEVFADKEAGHFMSIAEIVGTKTSVYEDDAPSSGAVSARAFPKGRACTLVGVEPFELDGKKGLRKLAAE